MCCEKKAVGNIQVDRKLYILLTTTLFLFAVSLAAADVQGTGCKTEFAVGELFKCNVISVALVCTSV